MNMETINPYRIEAPAVISFSGGRTSGYMLYHILQAYGGVLPDDVKVCFTNTGKEREETLNFIQACANHWCVPIVWLEYDPTEEHLFRAIGHNSASHNGEPFEAVIANRHFLPNPVTRFCTSELKIKTSARYVRAILGWVHWDCILGMRADEPGRMAKARKSCEKERWENIMPLATAGVTKRHVTDFWMAQPFDLKLPNLNNKTSHGNCDLCFLKAEKTIQGLMREEPGRAAWWIEQEKKLGGKTKSFESARFRSDRRSYAELLQGVYDQEAIEGKPDEDIQECYCHD
jgi:3'-phosphoadenosine 5'-phosphosulfate sulfotransferase (PAPS reductase)/FAD synthetase